MGILPTNSSFLVNVYSSQLISIKKVIIKTSKFFIYDCVIFLKKKP